MRHLLTTLIGSTLALAACTAEGPLSTRGGALQVTPLDEQHYGVAAGADRLATVPVASIHLDRVEAALSPDGVSLLLVIEHGEDGGASLLLLERDRQRTLLRTGPESSLSRPAWSPDGSRFALVLRRPPRWVGSAAGPVLQHQGELLIGSTGGDLARRGSLGDLSRVLGWDGADSLLLARHARGDLPSELPARIDLTSDRSEAIAVAGHLYNLELLGGRLAYVRTDEPVVTLPAPGQPVALALAGLDGSGERVLAAELGRWPNGMTATGNTLRYRLEGTHELRSLPLDDGLRTAPVGAGELADRDLTLAPRLPEAPDQGLLLTSLPMPYVHQVYDTPDDFAGSWACGPTSTLMAVQRFNRLAAWPVTISTPTKHTNDFGAYVAYKYTAFGTTFNRMQTDAKGKPAYGAYGWCTDGGGGWAWRMQDYAKKHQLSSDFSSSSSFTAVKNAIDAGKVVVLSTQLTSAGHIITVKGYTADGKLIVNDPYGNKTLGTYPNYKGGDTVYSWSYVYAKWHITVYGAVTASDPPYKASLASKSFPTTIVAGATAKAKVSFKNLGTATWDAKTRLGTSEPKDRESPFVSADWIEPNRPAAASSTKPEATASFEFTLTAPKVTVETSYKECFNLLQEGKAWFSDKGQGGPADTALCVTIKVTPAPVDADGDGVTIEKDCDDSDPAVLPGATEICNEKDDNCDGAIDEGLSCDPDPTPSPLPPDGGSPPPSVAPPRSDESDGMSGGCALAGLRGGLESLPLPLLLLLALWGVRRRRQVTR
jgi:hypothetical protein